MNIRKKFTLNSSEYSYLKGSDNYARKNFTKVEKKPGISIWKEKFHVSVFGKRNSAKFTRKLSTHSGGSSGDQTFERGHPFFPKVYWRARNRQLPG